MRGQSPIKMSTNFLLEKNGANNGLYKGLNKGLGNAESPANRAFTDFLVADISVLWWLIYRYLVADISVFGG